jgi:hypothetical protein
VLVVPRVGLEIAGAPLRGGLWAYDRFNLRERFRHIFWNDAGTFGAFPLASLEGGFGLSAGAQMVHTDLFAARERVTARARYGGRYRQAYDLKLKSGERLGEGLELIVRGQYQRKPKERFFGIGNGDLVPAEEVAMPIDPTTDDTAVATRFRDTRWEAGGALDARLASDLNLRLGFEWIRRTFDRSDRLSGDAPLEEVYDPMAVVGFGTSIDDWSNQAELRYDTRRGASEFASAAMPGKGVLLAGHVGHHLPVGDRPGFFHYGCDLQAFFDLYRGSRVLGLRLMGEQIDAELDQIPFVLLPSLGGDGLLRGYQSGRFRDRALLLASAEYKWEIQPQLAAAYLFIDAGRVERSLVRPELDSPRVGFGAGVQLHTMRSLLMRMTLASSLDGGIFFNLDFDPVIDISAREVSLE